MLLQVATAIGLSTLACYLREEIGTKLGLMDRPDGVRKLHRQATPLIGGVALMFGLTPQFTLAAPADLRIIFFSIFCLFVLGVLDDRKSVSPRLRFTILFGVVLFLVQSAAVPDTIYFVLGFADTVLTISDIPWRIFAFAITFAIVGFIVSVNMADGINGLAPGLLLLWSALYLCVAPEALQPTGWTVFAVLAVIVTFNLAGLLFMGDSGIYGAASLIAVLILGQAMDNPASLPLDTIAVWVSIPVLDCLRLIVLRSVQGKSPFQGDRNHLHHRLLEVMTPGQACAIYLASAALPSVLALALPAYNSAWLALAGGSFVLMVNAAKVAPTLRRLSAPRLQQSEPR